MNLKNKLANGTPTQPQQTTQPNNFIPPKQPKQQTNDGPSNKSTMLYVIAGAAVCAIAASIFLFSQMAPKDTLTPESSIIMYQPNPEEEPIEVDVASLLTKVDSLEEQVTQMKSSPSNESGIAYMPESVTAIADFNKDEADFLKANSLYQVKEPIPYKKMYVQLSDSQYGFYALIDYGGAKSLIPIHYSDYKDLKPEGVTYFNIEYATIRPEGAEQDKGLTVGITIDPKWRENLEADYN